MSALVDGMQLSRSRHAASLALFTAIALPHALAGAAVAIEPGTQVVLQLRDGRRPQGSWAKTSEPNRVRLRSDFDAIVIESTFARQDLNDVSSTSTPLTSRPYDRAIVADLQQRTRVANAEKLKRPAGRIQSIGVEAAPANWDADAEPDGLLVRLIPLGEQRDVRTTSGELTMTLLAYVRDSYESDSLALIARPREIERVSYVVREADFAEGSAVYRFPYRRNDPSRDPDIEPYCRVHVRLGIPTQGVFEADASVQLRASDPIFDRLPYFETLRP